jgi:SAM-dependent methyltransferase
MAGQESHRAAPGPTGPEAVTDADPVTEALRRGYDAVAEPYADRFAAELADKPLDRALLGCFAEQVAGLGPVADVGCGPGQVARWLHERGLPVLGVDLSPEMVAVARRHHPGIDFRVGTMLALDAADGAWGGIVAFYSIIHLPPGDLPAALGEFHRVLRPGGLLLVAFHVGQERVHVEEFLERPVSIDFYFLEPAAVAAALAATGFTVEARVERRPVTPDEAQTQRCYLLARRS